eukprot:IDg4015t1
MSSELDGMGDGLPHSDGDDVVMLSQTQVASNAGDAGNLALAAPGPLDAEVVCVDADEVPLLNLRWSSRSKATAAIRLQQADQNTTLVTSSGKGGLSGGKCFVMVCPDATCTAKATVRKSVEKAQQAHLWSVQRSKTQLSHSAQCTTSAMYRSRQLAAAEELTEVKKSYELIQPYADESLP